jgi:hypothetical protein
MAHARGASRQEIVAWAKRLRTIHESQIDKIRDRTQAIYVAAGKAGKASVAAITKPHDYEEYRWLSDVRNHISAFHTLLNAADDSIRAIESMLCTRINNLEDRE